MCVVVGDFCLVWNIGYILEKYIVNINFVFGVELLIWSDRFGLYL